MEQVCALLKMALNEQTEPMGIKDVVHHRLLKHICPVQLAMCWLELEEKREIQTFWRGKKEDDSESKNYPELDELFAELNTDEYIDIVGYLQIV